jgi:DNA-binding FrmR family transcriptional regulator
MNQAANKENEDNTMNKNNGLINTIVNHNEKLKVVENKINYIVNNFANSSHVKEVVEKAREIEKHIYGAPRPHASWRELVLVLVCLAAVLVALHQLVKKVVLPYLLKYINEKTVDKGKVIKSISEQVDNNNGNKGNTYNMDWNLKWNELNSKVEQLENKSIIRTPTTYNFSGDKNDN